MMRYIKKFKFPLKILISVGILGLIIQRMDIDILKEASHRIDASAWAFATLLILIQLFLISYRWMLLINVGKHRMSYPVSLQVTLASQIANLLLIPIIAGAAVRITVCLQKGASLFKSIFATAIDRVMTLAALSLFCAVFLPSLSHFVELKYLRDLAVVAGVTLIIIFVFMPLFILLVLPKLPERLVSKANMRSGVRYLISLFNNHFLMAKIVFLSLLAQMCFFAATYLIAVSAGITLSALQMMVVLPAIALVSSLPLSIGGWGVREGAFIFGLGLLAVPAEVAFSASVQIGFIGILSVIIAGLPALFMGKFYRLFVKVRQKNK